MNYYLLLIGIILLNLKFKKKSIFYLWIGFCLFLAGALINLVRYMDLSEVITRISLAFLLIGFALNIKEYKTGK